MRITFDISHINSDHSVTETICVNLYYEPAYLIPNSDDMDSS